MDWKIEKGLKLLIGIVNEKGQIHFPPQEIKNELVWGYGKPYGIKPFIEMFIGKSILLIRKYPNNIELYEVNVPRIGELIGENATANAIYNDIKKQEKKRKRADTETFAKKMRAAKAIKR